MEYAVASAPDLTSLWQFVAELLVEGYEPLGGLAYGDGHWAQALVRRLMMTEIRDTESGALLAVVEIPLE